MANKTRQSANLVSENIIFTDYMYIDGQWVKKTI